MIGKFLSPKNDFAFKHIFGSERHSAILIHFLNDILEFTGDKLIEKVTFLKPNQDPEVLAQKYSLVDVLCQDQKGRQYIIEMQVAKRAGFEKRAQYYAAKTYSRQLNDGENYHDLKEVIFLAITDFVMFPDKKVYKSNHVILDQATYTRDLKDFSFTFLELPKFTKNIDELTSMVDKWAYFFKHAEETNEKELPQIVGEDKIIEQAYEALNRFSMTEVELNSYDREIKRELDTVAVLLNAKLEGKSEEQIEMAKRMLSDKVDDAIILKYTALSKEALQSLKEAQ